VTGFIVEKTGTFYFAFVWVCVNLIVSALSYLLLVPKVEEVSWESGGRETFRIEQTSY